MLGCYLPRISNLELGFLYSFGNRVRTGRFTADYVLPMSLGKDALLFGEAHGEYQGFWKKTPDGSQNRTDLSLGGGYRKMLGDNALLGANAFYDSSRLFNRWYSSGGLGVEMAAIVGADDALDVNFNWYGNLFSRTGFVNAFRNQGGSFDVEAGYSHALFDHTLDLRVQVAGYQFDIGQKVYGWRGGVDLTTRDGMFTAKYQYGHDKINGSYNTVGAFVNIGFQLENVLKGASPVTMPEPVFKSPRNIRRMLTRKVKRNWHMPAQVLARAGRGGGEAHFELVINPPYWCDGGDCSAGFVETESTSRAIWRIRFTHQTGDDWCGASGGYTIRLVGNTSGLVFPLTVTITPSGWRPWINEFTVRQDYGNFDFETTIMANPGDLVKNIPPDGGTGVVVPGEHPRIHRNIFTGAQVGFQGRFTISAPGVTPLEVDIISSN